MIGRKTSQRVPSSSPPTGALILFLLPLAGCAAPAATPPSSPPAPEPAPITWVYEPQDEPAARRIEPFVSDGFSMIDDFFGAPFPQPFTLRICPDRAAFTQFFKDKWGIDETQCWWVATGVADGLTILSPQVWTEQACEHDPDDDAHVRGIVVHELVHVYHGQHNPGFEELDDIGWFIEGLATYASGQLELGHLASPREAILDGAAPARLAGAWSGKYRYGVSGTLVQYIDVTYGREMIVRLLPARTEAEILDALGLTEDELLANWRAFVLAGT